MNARFLSAPDPATLAARFGDALTPADRTALSDASEAHLLAIDGVTPETLTALRHAGATVVQAGATWLVAATRAQLNAALRDASPADQTRVAVLLAVIDRAQRLPSTLRMRDRILDVGEEAHVMGIVNVTPDSFYERVGSIDEVVAKTRAMVSAGAVLVDVGGQSYANQNRRIAAEEERQRVVPAVRAIVESGIDVAISIDTFKASVADAALAAGAHLINDCSGMSDPELPGVVAKYDAGLVVMHLKGELMVRDPSAYVYRDALAEIIEFLYERTERAVAAGVSRDAILIDPGLEFGKEPHTDLEILDRFAELRSLGYPILFASSRKSFIGRIFDRPAKELLIPSLATAAIGINAGARIVRVHDVEQTVQFASMMAAVRPGRRARIAIADHMPPGDAPGGNSRSGAAV